MQVRLPATMKANTQEAGADEKESIFIQVPAIWKMGTLVSKPISASRVSWLGYIGELWEEGN